MSNNKETAKLTTGQMIAFIVIVALNILWIVCNLVLYSEKNVNDYLDKGWKLLDTTKSAYDSQFFGIAKPYEDINPR